jgi:hypothetical protein
MPNQHKTKMIGWHSADPTAKPWVEAEAERRGVPAREILDEALSEYRRKHEAGEPSPAHSENGS